jgi:hypothetical protein
LSRRAGRPNSQTEYPAPDALDGTYPADVHMLGIDLLAVPAAAYFLWVVHASAGA